MTVILYKSTDASAPVLSGQVGALVALLDACLVNGYGALPAAGWTKSFAGTNTATYRQGTGSNQLYLHVNDNGPGAGGAKEARVFGSETASAVLTGVNLFPTAAQFANGLFWRKSTTADATARAWIVVADERTMYLFLISGDSATVYLGMMFGEFYSLKPTTDNYRCMITGRGTENSATLTTTVDTFDCMTQLCSSTLLGHYLVRNDQGDVGALVCGKQGDVAATASAATQPMNGIINWYNRPDGNLLYLAPLRLTQASPVTIRGYMRGLYHFCHAISNVNDGDTFSGAASGPLVGKSFLIIKGTGNNGVFVLETSNTWDAN